MRVSSEQSVFLAALEKDSPAEREEYLSQACGHDAGLRASVESLLRAHEQSENPLDNPPSDLISQFGETWDEAAQHGSLGSDPGVVEGPGTVVGDYKLLEKIGEGGFGLVFVAEQQRPVRRKVAMKIVKPGMDTRDVVARFEAERQALAMMDHPNIARVFDAGSTATGRPYFVMELVRGIAITEFCEQRHLDTRERLELFVMVCRGVQHAHQKGVIHRDIKPSNVLVTLHDGTPVVKVIDFGVAKAIGQTLTEKTIYTRFTAMIGTPLYMSPEQAEMSGLDVDTRSDIYSLGMLLYELVTGATPFDEARLDSAGLDELRRIIREEDPPRPSTRLSTPSDGVSKLAPRWNTSYEHSMLIRGDLDWVVMKAIEKDRTRRYETANALAADVLRFLRDEPVEARPPSRLYRLRKFVHRRKATFATVSIVVLAMVLGTGISIWQAAVAVAERNEKERALDEAVQARNEANQARKEIEEFSERLKEANLLLTSGRAHADADRWADANADYSQAIDLQPNYYLVWVERGQLYARLGLWNLSAADYEKAYELGAPATGASWWGVPQLLWLSGSEDTSREICTHMLQTEEETSRGISQNTIRACLLSLTDDADFAALANLAERDLQDPRELHPPGPPRGGPPPEREHPGQRRRPPPGAAPPPHPEPPRGSSRADHPGPPGQRDRNRMPHGASVYVAGWAHYRAGQYEQAIERLEESDWVDPGWPGRGIAYPLLAMAYHQTGQQQEAHQALATGSDLVDQWTQAMLDSPVGSMPIPWFDWVEFLVLYREATTLITGESPPVDPRLASIEARALQAIGADNQADSP